MRVLLDTHAFLFAINPWEKLPLKVKQLLEDPNTERWLSAISLWEIAVKVRIGKLDLPPEPSFYARHLNALGGRVMSVEAAHVNALFSLPLHHRDPFDRLLIAQAKAEFLTIITQDAAFSLYDVPTLW